MKTGSLVILGASVVVGLAGAGVAYDLANLQPTTETTVSSTVTPSAPTRRVRWKPCEPPAVLEGRSCVTELVKQVPIAPSTRSSDLPGAPARDGGAQPQIAPPDDSVRGDVDGSGPEDFDDDSWHDDHHDDDDDDEDDEDDEDQDDDDHDDDDPDHDPDDD